jgi:aminoglycoside phosphotransferase (APT) family kinase protein
MSEVEGNLYLWTPPEISSSEKNVVNDIIDQINAGSIVKIQSEGVEALEYHWNYDSYKVRTKEDNQEFVMKISFGDSASLSKEYDVLKKLANTGAVPYAMALHPVRFFSDDGIATLTKKIDGVDLFNLGIHEMFSHDEAVEEFFMALGKIYATDISSLKFIPRETTITSCVGNLRGTFGEEAAEKFNKIFNVKKFEDSFEELRLELTAKASQYNLDCIVNSDLNPFNIMGFGGDDINAPGVYINNWTGCFVGNPLYDFYNLIIENRLFSEKPRIEKIFFSMMKKMIPEVAKEMEELSIEYLNYFQVLQFWRYVEEYLSLSIETLIGNNVSIRSMMLKQKIESIRRGIFKISPKFEKMFSEFCIICDKIGEQKQKKEENDD